jgi:ectoine hydroxylase-related dioxygenase (phytanoyl-CoA dioxygenase family)
MRDWFKELGSGHELPAEAAWELLEAGFVVIPGPVAGGPLARLARAYDEAVTGADPAYVSVGSTTTRVHGLVNRGPEFDELYVYRPILEACRLIIGQPFKLSSLLARAVLPNAQAQPLHADFEADADGWPMVGFIFMVDDFRRDNGATRFVPGSHRRPAIAGGVADGSTAEGERQVAACGVAGSVIIYNGSVWHGHGASESGEPRRSIQGAYIRRGEKSVADHAAHILPQTRARIGPLAGYLLDI